MKRWRISKDPGVPSRLCHEAHVEESQPASGLAATAPSMTRFGLGDAADRASSSNAPPWSRGSETNALAAVPDLAAIGGVHRTAVFSAAAVIEPVSSTMPVSSRSHMNFSSEPANGTFQPIGRSVRERRGPDGPRSLTRPPSGNSADLVRRKMVSSPLPACQLRANAHLVRGRWALPPARGQSCQRLCDCLATAHKLLRLRLFGRGSLWSRSPSTGVVDALNVA